MATRSWSQKSGEREVEQGSMAVPPRRFAPVLKISRLRFSSPSLEPEPPLACSHDWAVFLGAFRAVQPFCGGGGGVCERDDTVPVLPSEFREPSSIALGVVLP